MIDIFKLMDEKFDIQKKVKNLSNYICRKSFFNFNFKNYTFIELFGMIFHEWKHNNCYDSVEDMLEDLDIAELDEYNNLNFKLSTNTECCKFLQFLMNALLFARNRYNGVVHDNEFDNIVNKINYINDKMNYKFIYKNDYLVITDSNPIVRKIAEKTDKETALQLLSYNEIENLNNIQHKRSILKYLSNITEPITKSYTRQSGDIYDLYDTLDFALNNLDIRHNNKEGKYQNNFIKEISESKLIKYYDDTFNLIIEVLASHNGKESYDRLADLKKIFKK